MDAKTAPLDAQAAAIGGKAASIDAQAASIEGQAASLDWRRELAVLMAVRVHGRADAVRVARTAALGET